MHPSFIFALALIASPLVAAHCQAAGDQEAAKPNILFILADDMGYGDLKVYNPESQIRTPHLNKLAQSGVRFTDAHAGGSTCKPSRYALLTGQFAARKDGLNDKAGPIISGSQPTIASVLRDNGYRTAMVGKWHLGFDQKARKPDERPTGFAFDYDQPLTGGPRDRGFDSYFGMHASLDIPPYFYIQNRTAVVAPTNAIPASTSVGGPEDWNRIQGAFWREGDIASNFQHHEVSQRFADEAAAVITSHNPKQPLFLYLALPSPHTPWLPAERFVGQSQAGMYGDFVMTVDDIVGQVLASLKAAKLTDNTLIMFSSDNGPVWYEKDVERFAHRSTGPLRGAKASAWEGGHRVPFLASWPGRIEPGSTSDHTIIFSDVLATFAELAGQTEIESSVPLDSHSFLAAMLDPAGTPQRTAPILHGGKVIREGDWKLINTKGSRGFTAEPGKKYGIALYNLKDDLAEQHNLADSMPDKVNALKASLANTLNP